MMQCIFSSRTWSRIEQEGPAWFTEFRSRCSSEETEDATSRITTFWYT